jgi:hypothetical protein
MVLPPSVTYIGQQALSGCEALSRLALPDGLKSVFFNSFEFCSGLTELVLPANLSISLGSTLDGCASLVLVVVPQSYNYFEQIPTFRGCPRLLLVVCDAPERISSQNCPLLNVVPRNPASLSRAVKLRRWSPLTHALCSAARRGWVVGVFLCAARLRLRGLELPAEMWLAVLERVPRFALGACL